MAPVIKAHNIHKRYPGFAPVLKGADIAVQPGEMAAIMGPSGCGKSTMLHILGLLHAPDSGTLEILDTDVLSLDRTQTAEFRRENMGFVMQASNLFEHSTVFENVEFPLIYDRIPPQERWERVIRALELVHLSGRVHYRSNRLSGGEQQRVAIARAMVNNPKILLADEPTGALDARTSVLIMENFRRLCHEGGVAMIMVTHDPKMADYCDSIYTLEDGRLKTLKHEPPHLKVSSADFLATPDATVKSALVVQSFPAGASWEMHNLAGTLNSARELARIYSLSGNGFLSGSHGYTLPLAVRHPGLRDRLHAFLDLFKAAPANVRQAQKGIASLAGGFWSRLSAFRMATSLARWGKSDEIELFLSASATAFAPSLVAARILERPFALYLHARDLKAVGKLLPAMATLAAFIACPNRSVLEAVQSRFPLIDNARLKLSPPALPASINDESAETGLSQDGAPLAIICDNPESNPHAFSILLKAAAILKKQKQEFQLSVLGKGSFAQHFLARRLGIGRCTRFMADQNPASAIDAVRQNSVFIAWVPSYADGEFALPYALCVAMACGLCILPFNLGKGLDEVLRPGVNCEPPANSPKAVAQCLFGLAQSPEHRSSLGSVARSDIRAMYAGPDSSTIEDLVRNAGKHGLPGAFGVI